jgi:hypothetical protein
MEMKMAEEKNTEFSENLKRRLRSTIEVDHLYLDTKFDVRCFKMKISKMALSASLGKL